MRRISCLWRERRFLRLYIGLLVELATRAAVKRVRARCPGLPDLSGTPDAAIGFAPSVVVGALLRFAMPVYVGLFTGSLRAVGTSIVVGRVAFRSGDALVLRRVDRMHHARWQHAGARAKRLAGRITTLSLRTSGLALRAGVCFFAVAAGSAALALAASALGASHAGATSFAGAIAILALLIALVLMFVMFAAMTFEALAPTLLGPAADNGYLVSRADVELLRPLTRSGPAGVLRDVWDVLKTLRP